ncbi:hypothetical protein RvY_15086 [Ramazzottius varieornatus]|uniref:Ig-like domain-containing protein n=1 Tax=Ramazzottius varieornatus TaxID=947166 RepID=A0A1D1VYI1_RAMVA|nr:hypothetical protein RvY_15086 [Ramazzottius varieornatus]
MIFAFLSLFLLIFHFGSTASSANLAFHKHDEKFPDDFCDKYDQYLTAWKACFLLNGTNIQSQKYHEIICMDPSDEALRWSLEVYAKQECKRPLRLYITQLRFNPDPNIFRSVADHLVTLFIKSWEPEPVENAHSHVVQTFDHEGRYYLKGHPFLHLKHVKHLDIEFATGANFNSIPTGFFNGLDGLEALIIENLPRGSSIALGTFQPLALLKCITILGTTISCSCQANDHPSNRGHWLHQWLHRHGHLWSSADFQKPVTYQDTETREGRPFTCKVKVDCEVTIDDPPSKLIVDFHKYKFHRHCLHNTSTTVVTTYPPSTAGSTTQATTMETDAKLDVAPPCESMDSLENRAAGRKARNNNSRLPDGQVLCKQEPEYPEPISQESRSSAPVRNGGHLILVAMALCTFGGI